MRKQNLKTVDGNTAAAHVAYAFSEVAAIYPITPSSPMGELSDQWSANGRTNVYGQTVEVVEMQSEGGASGAIHGSLTGGALTTTFTSSQGLMLMLPNMFKIAGELLPAVFHVAARSLACQSLSIFADHSDVMATRGTGYAIMSASSIQEIIDLGIVSHLAAVEASVPFLNFFDGFRNSHEIQKVDLVEYETLKTFVNHKNIEKFRQNALNPEHPVCKVGAENPDVYFQGRETVNPYHDKVPSIVKKYMALVKDQLGREYNLFDYVGAPDAESIIIAMNSANETIEETVKYLNSKGKKVGAIKVRLFRPFSIEDFVSVIPSTVKKIAVMDRTKEPGGVGEPMYLDVVAALKGKDINIIGGRYGLSSKEFTPIMVKAIFDHLDKDGFHGFTVGIKDDVTNLSLPLGEEFDACPVGTIRCKFWGYGSDGTVGANKNSIKIIGDNTDMNVQGHFEYDSKKSGGITISHLRFGKQPIQSEYCITVADFIALHKHSYIGHYDILDGIKEGGTFLINSPWPKEEVFKNLTKKMQDIIKEKKIKVYCLNAFEIAKKTGMRNRINTIMQVGFFKLTEVIPFDKALELIKASIKKTYGHKGEEIVKKNIASVEAAVEAIEEVPIIEGGPVPELYLDSDNEFEKNVVARVMRLKGNDIPVSQMTRDGSVPLGTTKLEKRGIANEVPKWKPENCIQCGFCSFVCPHAAIRIKQIIPKELEGKPGSFNTVKSNTKNDRELQFKVQIFPEDCTGCGNCIETCPTKNKSLEFERIEDARAEGENDNVKFFEKLSEDVTDGAPEGSLKWTQLKKHHFEFSGACAGCGETPYVRLASQLFGDRMVIANATGCSSIYGGTFPTIPFCANKEGKGPAWANSLFEDNAEYGYGMRLAVDQNRKQLRQNLNLLLQNGTTEELKSAIRKMLEVWNKVDDEAKTAAKNVVEQLPGALETVYGDSKPILEKVNELKDFFVDKSVWIIGGDGWAYDIGYGGLDHVLAMGRNVNVLVLDTEVYSNTGGQQSKATPLGAIAKFASAGRPLPKKNLGLMMTTYGYVYVANVSMGANRNQVLKAMIEAEKYEGPSIIIAYCPCIAHGVNLSHSQQIQKNATESGYWPLYRYNPSLALEGKDPFIFETPEPKLPFKDYALAEKRYSSLKIVNPKNADKLMTNAEESAKKRLEILKSLKKD